MQDTPANPFPRWVPAIVLAATLLPSAALGQQSTRHQPILELVDQRAAHFSETSRTIWGYAELGYQEQKSSALLQRELQTAGFRVQVPVADEPTAFVATYGQGEPVIGILGEFDALPGLSQAATPDRSPVVADAPTPRSAGAVILPRKVQVCSVDYCYLEGSREPETLVQTPASVCNMQGVSV